VEAQAREPQMGLTFEKVWAMFQESDRQMQALRESLRESQQETERLLQESHEKAEREMKALREAQQETARVVKETSNNIGGLNGRFGDLAEHLVAPNIEEKFNALGYHFKDIVPHQKIKNEKGQIIAEIDILLENNDYIIAIEVKSKPKKDDIDAFKRRLEILRKHRNEIHDSRRIHGAIAGAIFEDSVKKAVLKAGFYVIEQSGDTVKINVPKGFKPKEW
jgi:hypothetical protein